MRSAFKGESKDFLRGYIAGLWLYAWWKDGVEYVGTSATLLKVTIKEAKKIWKEVNK